MYCCPNCFSDDFLKESIRFRSTLRGDCLFCRTANTDLVDPEVLLDMFQPLLGLYRRSKRGNNIVDLIQNDWHVFALEGQKKRQRLVKAISCNKDIFKTKYTPVFAKEQKNIEQWEEFREELKHNNRFFPKEAPLITDIRPFGDYIGVILVPGSQLFYRARINDSDTPFTIANMGKPDKFLASNGRANPVGIPYLYLASTPETAIAEVRGHVGEKLTVAEFEINSRLELADLRDPINTISPFQLSEEDELQLLYKNMPFLSLLGNELSKPVIPRTTNLEYLSSQYLCELIKHIGFHGIIYKSSLSDGSNYVIFNDDKLTPINTHQFQITSINTTSKEL